MRIPKITLNFARLRDSVFENKAKHILESMTDNPNFPDPIPTLVQLQTAITNYSNALVAAAELGKNNVANKNKYRSELELLLFQLGMFVMFVANGNVTILISSGYTLSKEPEPQHLENPGMVMLENGISTGQLVATIKKPAGARSFAHEICDEQPTPATVWNSTPTSRSSFVFNGLLPGKQYWVRVAVTGSAGQIAYSTVSTQFAQ